VRRVLLPAPGPCGSGVPPACADRTHQPFDRCLFLVISRPSPRGSVRLSHRKEVIQPHLPVRLPCYDFTLLTRRTFDVVPHCWLD
jgi:hypothetical protein